MQVKIFTIPLVGGERITEEMNIFLRSKKVLQVEHHLIKLKKEAFWSFYIKYVDEIVGMGLTPGGYEKPKIDYREVLDETSFKRFSKMREVRKALAKAENIPAFTILTDAQMAQMAQQEELSVAAMKAIKGLGEKTIEKYSKHFMAIEI